MSLPERPHKSGGSLVRKAPPGRHYPVYICAYKMRDKDSGARRNRKSSRAGLQTGSFFGYTQDGIARRSRAEPGLAPICVDHRLRDLQAMMERQFKESW